MKLGLFSDTHYAKADVLVKTRRPRLSFDKVKKIYKEFENANVDAVFCLGDLVDCFGDKSDILQCAKELLDFINSFPFKTYIIAGNHDYACFTKNEQVNLGFLDLPCVVTILGNDFICLDANYTENGIRYDNGKWFWTDTKLPKEQVDFLRLKLKGKNKKIVAVHQVLDFGCDNDHVIANANEIRKIIEDGGVSMVIQGHFHRGNKNVINGIPYVTLPAVCEGEKIPFEIIEI